MAVLHALAGAPSEPLAARHAGAPSDGSAQDTRDLFAPVMKIFLPKSNSFTRRCECCLRGRCRWFQRSTEMKEDALETLENCD